MNYELVKQLKDVGFPVRENRRLVSDGKTEVYIVDPTLSELIEACGDSDYFHLERDASGRWKAGWFKKGVGDFGYWDICETPEEAVARLWLKLIKDKI